jgi:uncharacterized membrane protein (DUF485 family)
VNERLPRNIPGPGQNRRYGRWDMAGDREPGTALPSAEVDHSAKGSRGREEEVRKLMRRQLRLSTAAAVLLFGVVFAAVLVMYLAPTLLGNTEWLGFRLDFLFAAILIYPLTWLVATVYTLIANRLDGLR